MRQKLVINLIKFLTYALIIVVPLIFWKWSMYPFQIIKTSIFQSLVEIIFALWLGLAIFDKRYRPRLTPLFLAVSGLALILFLSAVFAADWRVAFWSNEGRNIGVFMMMHFWALFAVLVSLCEEIRWEKFFSATVAVSAVVSAAALLQLVWLQKFFLTPGIAGRPGTFFGNPAFLAGYALLHIFIAGWLLTKNENRASRLLLILTILLNVMAVFLTQTLGAVLGLATGILVLIFWSIFSRAPILIKLSKLPPVSLRKIAVAALLIILAFSSVFFLTRQSDFWQKVPALSRAANLFSSESVALRNRLIAWHNAWRGFLDRPILGWGWANYNLVFDTYYDPRLLGANFSETYWDKPHNVFMEYLSTTGILGFLLYLGILGMIFHRFFKMRISADPTQLNFEKAFLGSGILVAGLVAYYVQNSFLFDTIGTALVFYLLLAFADNSNPQKIIYEPRIINYEPRTMNFEFPDSIRKYQTIVSILLLTIALVPIYYNYQIFAAATREWRGVNYFLNGLTETSLLNFEAAVATPSPYTDDIRKNFSGTIKQAYQQSISYPKVDNLQKRLVKELEEAIRRHPRDYFIYAALADFKSTFWQFDPKYLDEADELAKKALSISPNRQQMLYIMAKNKIMRGDYKAAYELFKETIKLNPQAGEPHFYFGILAYQLGDVETGDEEIRIAALYGRVPKRPQEAIALGNYVGDLKKNYSRAIDYYKQAIYWASPGVNNIYRWEAQLKMGVAYYLHGDPDLARQTFLDLSKEIDLRTIAAYNQLKPVFEELGLNF